MELLNDNVINLIITSDEVENLDYSVIDSFVKQVEEKGNVLGNRLVLNFEGYKETPEEIYKVPSIRRWVKGLIDKYPYIFYFLNPDYGINALLIVACVGDIKEIDMKTPRDMDKNILSEYELVSYKQKLFKVKLSKDVSNKIIEGLIEYGLKLNLDSDDVLFTILSIPGLNGG